jgi:purine-binding chemotaxis protein CheW
MSEVQNEAQTLLVTGFTINQSLFGVDAKIVQEVVKVGELTQIHHAPPGVVGIRNLRGKIVTVIDLAVHLGLGSVAESDDRRLLIMEEAGEVYGFLVESVTEAYPIETAHLDSPPPSMHPELQKQLLGVWHHDGKVMAVIKGSGLFQFEEIET